MMQKKDSRLRRSRATRMRIGVQKADRLTVNRTNTHIYASVISGKVGKVLCTAPTSFAAATLAPLPFADAS